MRRLLRIVSALGGIAIVLVVLGYVWENHRGKRAWKDFVAESEALGETLDLAALIPEPVPDEDNFASIPLMREAFVERDPAAGELYRLDAVLLERMRVLGPRDWRGKGSGVLRGSRQTGDAIVLTEYLRNEESLPEAEAAKVVLEELAKFEQELSEVSEGVTRPRARFPVRWEMKMAAAMPHLSGLQAAAQALGLRSLAHLRVGDPQAALDDFLATQRLAKLANDDSTLMNLLVMLTMHDIALQPLWEGLERQVWSEAQMAAVEDGLEGPDLRVGVLNTIRFERAMVCAATLDLAESTSWLGAESELKGLKTGLNLMPEGWLYRNAVTHGRVIQNSLLYRNGERVEILGYPEVEALKAAVRGMKRIRLHPYKFFAQAGLPVYGVLFERLLRTQADINNARVSVALERYRILHGAYPDALEALEPDLLESLPVDVISGESLKYRLRADGRPCIYSVGIDRFDEGGLPRDEPTIGDWAWQYSVPEGFELEDYFGTK